LFEHVAAARVGIEPASASPVAITIVASSPL
jgi:hypothetical protein